MRKAAAVKALESIALIFREADIFILAALTQEMATGRRRYVPENPFLRRGITNVFRI